MGDKMRWRYGDTNPVIAAVDGATVIEIGDLVFQDGDNAKPPQPNDSGVIQPAQFADSFLGVAMQRSQAGETDPIRVATTGVFEFGCEPQTAKLGDYVMAVGKQSVHLAPAAIAAIGRVARREPISTTSIFVDIRSTVMTGGVRGSIAQP